MRLFRRQQAEPIEELPLIDDEEAVEDEAPAEPEYGPDVLREGPLLARWFILFELEREMKRASRHERALSIMVLMPFPTLGYVPSDASDACCGDSGSEGHANNGSHWVASERRHPRRHA